MKFYNLDFRNRGLYVLLECEGRYLVYLFQKYALKKVLIQFENFQLIIPVNTAATNNTLVVQGNIS